jgi:hypothetical protein
VRNRSPRVAQLVRCNDFAVQRVYRVELLTVGADPRLVSVAPVGGHFFYERLDVPTTIGAADRVELSQQSSLGLFKVVTKLDAIEEGQLSGLQNTSAVLAPSTYSPHRINLAAIRRLVALRAAPWPDVRRARLQLKLSHMEKDFVVRREFDTVFLGRLVKGTCSMSREGLVTFRRPAGARLPSSAASPRSLLQKGCCANWRRKERRKKNAAHTLGPQGHYFCCAINARKLCLVSPINLSPA